jgi:uncharacterized linocin/CFP29 family protein
MDLLKRNLAPINNEAWEEIETTAENILKTYLSARKFVDLTGPKGWDYAAEPLGRLYVPEGQGKDSPRYGIHQVLPLIEIRKSFKLEVWELDNILRGAKDVNLDPLEEATRQVAKFEEDAIYNGSEHANIKGMLDEIENTPINVKSKGDNFLAGINKAVTQFRNLGIGGPYNLVISPSIWESLIAEFKGYPLKKHISDITGGKIIFSSSIQTALLITARDGDFELILGNDFSIGYESHNKKEVELFITESFTFRVLEPKAIIQFKFQE